MIMMAHTQALPAFAEAPEGSLLNDLDHRVADQWAAAEECAGARRYETEKRALALWRGEHNGLPGTGPVEPSHSDDSDTIARRRAAKSAALTQGHGQTQEEYDREVAAFKVERFIQVHSGKRHAMTMQHLDFDPHAGAYVSRSQRYGGQWSEPRAVAFAQTRPARASQLQQLPRVRRGSSRARRPGFRRTAPSRAGPGDDDGGSEPPGRSTASGAAVWRLSALDRLTPASFHEEAGRFLVGVAPDRVGTTKARIFASLSAGLQREFWDTLGADIESDFMRVGHDTWVPEGASAHVQLRQPDLDGGAA